jgi:uncharacterized protein
MARLVGLLIVAFLFLLVVRSVSGIRDLFRKARESDRRVRERQGGEMVEDPVCRTYIPKSSAVQKTISGKTYYFCSRKCADAFSGN